MKTSTSALMALGAALSVPAFAQKPASTQPAKQAGAQAQSAAMSEGEVRKVDRLAKKITIKHGPLKNLDMDAMTMVFGVKDPAMLDRVKVGDRIRFDAEMINGQVIVSWIEPAK